MNPDQTMNPDTKNRLLADCSIILKKRFQHWMAIALLIPVAGGLRAESLEYAGVLGNSGIEGAELVRVNTGLKGRDGGGLRSGVALDRDARVWLSGGEAFNCLDLEGRLLKRFPLQPAGSRIDTSGFALLDGVLYGFGHLPKADPKTGSDVVLFALPPGGAPSAEAVASFPEYPSHRAGVLCPTPHDGKLLYAYAEEKEKRIVIGAYDSKTKERIRLMEIPGDYPSALAIDPDGQALYLGGYFGKYIGANIHQPRACEIVKLTWDGKELWRRVCLETPAEPTQFRGVVSVAGDAVWDAAWYGFLARFDRNGKTAPGKVASWDIRIPSVTQIVDVRGSLDLLAPKGVAVAMDPLLLSTSLPGNAYFANWDDQAGVLQLDKRYGSLPELGNIHLSPDGWVNAGGLWWRFDDAANAAPRFANHTAATSPGAWRGEWISAMTTGERTIPVVGRPAFGRESAQSSQDAPAPFTQVKGFAVAKSGDPAKTPAYATDGKTNKIWRTTMEPRLWAPRKEWKELAANSITAPGDIAVLDDGSLIVVDGPSIVRLEVSGDALRETARLTQWGQGTGEKFGQTLRLTADGKRLLVSDTDRQRVLLFDAASFKPLAAFGATDQAGSGANQFDHPGSVALSGERAIVADVNNQRIVKLRVK